MKDLYEYFTNKGILPYRLMGGMRYTGDFYEHYDDEYCPIKHNKRPHRYTQDEEKIRIPIWLKNEAGEEQRASGTIVYRVRENINRGRL